MKRVLKWMGWTSLLPLLWLALVATHWLPSPRPGDAQLLSVLQADPGTATGERNAFAILHSFAHEIPESDWDKVMEADRATFVGGASGAAAAGAPTSAQDAYPMYPSVPNEHPALCSPWVSDCLARVRANLGEAREWVEKSRARLERGEKLPDYDHYHYLYPPRFDSPVAQLGGGYFPALFTQIALRYLDGDRDAAFAQLCRHTAGWRRLRAHADSLIIDMVGVAQMSGAAQLYAQMLVEQPADYAPPCAEAFAPLTDAELNQCAVYRFEYLSLQRSIEELGAADMLAMSGYGGHLHGLFAQMFNPQHAQRLYARAAGRYCLPEQQQRVHARTAQLPAAAEVCSRSEWLFDPMGCAVVSAGLPDYDIYYQRVLDLDGRLRLLVSVLALRGLSGSAAEAAFERRSPALRSPAHPMSIDSKAGVLRMVPVNQSKGAYWEMSYAAPKARDAALD